MSWMDLHCHSHLSDGSFSIEEVVKKAAERGLTTVSLTDHDTVKGTEEAMHWGLVYGIQVIPGIEISAFDFTRNRKIHLLGYNYCREAKHIKELCTPLINARNKNTEEKIVRLEKAGYPVSIAEVRDIAGKAPALYKQHIMQLFINKGLTDCIYSDLYRKLFKNSGIGSGDIQYVDIFEAIEAVRKDGGYPVLAHPGFEDVYDMVPAMVDKGLWGMELHHEENTLHDRIIIKKLAKEYGLVLTGGSDCHGRFGSEHTIGDIVAPPSCFIPITGNENLRKKAAREQILKCGQFLKSSLHDEKELELKGNNPADLVTYFDKETEALLVDRLRNNFPEDHFLTEENETGSMVAHEGYTWIIDPIDGTTNFVHRQRDFSISLACYKDGKPWFGMVLDVVKEDLYEAEAGFGAFRNGMPLPINKELRTLEQSLADFSLHTLSSLNEKIQWQELAQRIRGHRAFGCASLILCQIAAGITDVYISSRLYIWDYAAGQIILSECGGAILTGEKYNPENLHRSSCVFLAAASPELLKEAAVFFSLPLVSGTHL